MYISGFIPSAGVHSGVFHSWKLTRALLTNSSWHAFPFSFLPPQAFRAEACRARPYEKVRAQGRCRGHWFMAFRLTEASSSLWPPDRKVIPVQGMKIKMYPEQAQGICQLRSCLGPQNHQGAPKSIVWFYFVVIDNTFYTVYTLFYILRTKH